MAPTAPRAAATLPTPTAPPAQGLFRGFTLQLNPPKAGSLAGARKRGRADSPPIASGKRARTQAGSSTDPADVRASGAADAPAADPAPMEMAPTTGPIVPPPGAGDVVIDLDLVAGMAEEPEVAPAPSPTTPTAAAAATTAVPEAALGDAPAATEAAEAGSPASQQEAALAGGAATPSSPQPFGGGAGEAAADEQQHAPPQADDPLSGQTVAASASSSSAATSSTSLSTLAGEEVELNSAKDRRARHETQLATVREELVKAGEDNAAKAAQLSAQASSLRKAKHALHLARTNHGTLIGQRELETRKLLGIAQSLCDVLSWFELRAARVDGTDVTTLIPFFSDLVGKLSALDVLIAKFCTKEIANCAWEFSGSA
ncbi:skin secretory protein xP2-like [Brachypodium distachyon]|uniref:skin secretory protein xP2-like n=1 Tax=Brachypodium distachyon TaxID=15368 RepID=UPI0005300AA7|nr:skin secretory protein xP2-like [Brachypodium distachyon]|eukprot:XP_010236494.1 skin secretory protein xP2-like [Brachypodium distachyon]